MKIEKLNENKLKITLDVNDLESRNIDVKSFITNTPESQDLFWDIMQEAEKEYEFNVDESMVYVEAHVNSSGNFTLIITKSNQQLKQPAKIKDKAKNFKLKRKEEADYEKDSLYEFASLVDLCSFCKIANIKEFEETKLYKYHNNFYLYAQNGVDKDILEFSNKMYNKNLAMAKIAEYGEPLIEHDALNQIKMNIK